MALVKKDYGLIYNDDGSLCTTIRDDDIPFQGVKSWVVEEATTNLFNSNTANFENGAGNWQLGGNGGYASISVSDEWAKFGNKSLKIEGTNGDVSSATGSYAQININSYMQNNIEYSFSFYVYNPNSIDIEVVTMNLPSVLIDSNNDLAIDRTIIHAGAVKRVWLKLKTSDNTIGWHLRLAVSGNTPNKTFYIDGCQFEQKPFATSFVDGSRPRGQIEIPQNSLGFDIANDDWVISYWKKPVATHYGTLTGYNTNALGRWSSGNTVGYIWWGKERNQNYFRLNIVNINNEGVGINSQVFDPTWYFNNWHFEILLKVGNLIKYYVDGILQISLTLSTPILNNFDRGLFIGGNLDYPHNSLISNLLFGKCQDEEGNLVWTDEFIQEVYQAKKPFAVQNQLSIY